MTAIPKSMRERFRLSGTSLLRTLIREARVQVPLDLDINLMYQTAFACLFIMSLFSLKSFAEFASAEMPRSVFLNFISLYVLGVFLIQCIFGIIVAFAALHCLRARGAKWAQRLGAIAYTIGAVVLVLTIELILEKLVLKPTFSFNRPGDTIGEPLITNFFRHIYGFEHAPGSSTPSGFVVRQTILALMFAFLIHQDRFFQAGRRWKLVVLHAANIMLVLLIVWLRLYTGAHRLYDAAIGIGIGGFLFWVLAFVFLSYKDEVRNRIADFALPALTFAFMVLLYSQDFIRWIAFCAVVMITLSLLFHNFSGIVSATRD